jgi:uncharacterized membrane protein
MAIVLYAAAYFMPGMPMAFEPQRDVYLEHRVLLLTHIVGGSIALALTPFQLWPRIRLRWPRAHRLMGRIVASAIVVGGVAGVGMSFFAYGGPSNRVGFGVLGVLWVFTTVIAVRRVRAGDLSGHRRWMIRSASLTFAAVTLRLWLGVLSPIVGFEDTYALVGWLSWVPNLAVAEWWIRSHRKGTQGSLAVQPMPMEREQRVPS